MDNLNKFQRHNLAKAAVPAQQETPREVRKIYQNKIDSLGVNDARQAVELERENRPVSAAEIDQAFEALRKQFGKHDGNRKVLEPGTTITEDMCRKVGVRPAVLNELKRRADAEFEQEVIRHHRDACLANPSEAAKIWEGNCILMMTESPVATDFIGRMDFFTWPDSENTNWNILVQAAYLLGLPEGTAPTLPEIIKAYTFARDNQAFHQQPAYKRSEHYLRDRVKPLSVNNIQNAKDDLFASGMAKLNSAKLPVGFRATLDKCRQLGLSDDEFYAVAEGYRGQHQEREFSELQADAQSRFVKTERRTV